MLTNHTADLLTKLQRARAPDALWSTTAEYLEGAGATHSIYTFVQPDNPAAIRAWTSLPDDWCQRYLDQAYHEVDPFYRYCCNTFTPVRTGLDYIDDHDFLNQQERRVILEGGETGFRSGFSAPVRLVSDRAFGGWNFGSGLPRREFEMLAKERGDDLRLAGFYIHEHLERLLRSDEMRRPARRRRLTPRERECLLWLSRGLRTAAIADRLGIAEVTVDLHFRNARKKLKATTREEALAKAVLRKLIHP